MNKPQSFQFTNGWTVSMELVPPVVAEKWLSDHNEGNRKVRRERVRKLARAMDNGEFKLSPDGLIFNAAGVLMQGQHRLEGIVQTGIPAFMVVWRNVAPDVFGVLDDTSSRSVADRLQLPRMYFDPVNVLCRLYFGQNYTLGEAESVLEVCSLAIERLHDSSAKNVRIYSQAPIRAAVILRIISDENSSAWTISQYAALTAQDYPLMDLSVQALNRQLNGDKKLTGNDLLVRAFIAFQNAGKSKTKIQVKTAARAVEKIRQIIEKALA